MRNFFTLFLIAIFAINLNAQNQVAATKNDTANYPYWFEMMQDPNADFRATQSAYNKYFENRTFTKGDGHKVFKRWEYFTQSRLNENGKRQAPDLVMNEYKSMLKNNAMFSPSGQWTELGPISMPTNSTGQPNGLGRINALAFHPTNNNIIWAGAPSGGLWKTTDSGSTWSSNTDNLPTLGISAILVDPSNTNTMYIGTGDRDGGDAPGLGVMKSIDGGQSWTSANTTMGNVTVNMMVMHPNNSSRIFAATSAGIYRSTDGASTWTKVSTTDNIKDIKFKPSSPGTMYAASSGTFYRSSNQGSSWSVVNSGLPSSGRFVIGVSPNNNNVVYIVAGGSSGFIGAYKSTNSGQSFTSQSTSPNILGYSPTGTDNSSQAYYDLCIAVDPSNVNTIYVGGVNIWKSTNGGSSWSLNSHWVGSGGVPAVHADIHTLDWAPNGVLYNGNDGGIYKTSNGGTTWTEISSGLAIAQVYKIGQSAGNSDLVINGYQDNGTAIYNNANSTWTTVIGGDGMECIIDPVNPSYKYGSLYFGDIRRSVNNGNFQQIADDGVNGINESGGWVTPFTLARNNTSTMYIGYENVWRSTNIKASSANNVSWTKISNFGSNPLQVIEHSLSNSNVLYVSRINTIWRSNNVNATSPTWTTLSAPAYVKDIKEFGGLYIAAGNNVYYSNNSGNSWTNISANLPNVSMNTLAVDTSNGGIYVGCDLGVYYLGASMSSWSNFSSGLPVAGEITELEIIYGTINKIRASTYGRGLWTSDLYSPANIAPTVDFAANLTNACPGETLSFTDYSSDNPTSWLWTISPSTYSFVGGTSASSQNPQIQFNAAGYYNIKLTASNAFGSDSLTKVNYVNVATPKTFAYYEDFQNFPQGNSPNLPFGWTKDDSGDFTWQGTTGSTPSATTGPSNDNTYGNSTGVYYYTEASLPSQAGDIARLVSSCIDIPNNSLSSMSFYYHMYGSAIIGLHIDVFHNGSWSPLDSIIGQQHFSSTANWTQKTISLSAYTNSTIKVRFWAERSASATHYYGDIAIDDIEFSIPGYPVANFTSSITQACGAEIVTLADQTTNSPTSWNWQITPSTFTFVNSTNASSQNPSVMFTAPGDYDIKLIASNSIGSDSILKNNFISISGGNPLPVGENIESFTVSSTTFNNGWTQENSSVNYKWYTNSGTTASNYTGPNVDHTLGTSSGKYIYAEASGPAVQSNVASFISPCIDLSNLNNAYLRFWYHMYGVNTGSLNIEILYNGTWMSLYTLSGQQQTSNNAAWLQASINLNNYLGGSVKFRFRAIRGSDYQGDIALDDIEILTLTPPANDDACGATFISAGSLCNFTTSTNDLASTSTGMQSPTCGSFNGADVWFKTVVPSSGYLTIKSETVTGSFVDGAMAVYSGNCGNMSLINCDDDSGLGSMPELNLNGLNPADTIFIRFWQNGGTQTGQFKICVYEPDYIDISPSNINVSGSLGNSSFNISASSNWTITDNASWLVVNPSSGNGSATVTASYSANSSTTRTATITVNSTGLNPVTATLTQYSSTFADFSVGNQYVCKGDNVTFTNASVNANSYKWFIDSVQVGTNTNLNHSFSSPGKYEVTLVSFGSSINDTTEKTIFVFDLPYADAGSDTIVCENEKVYFNAADSYGFNFCVGSNCGIPTAYCASAGSNDNFEYIHQLSLNSVQNISENEGSGYQDFSADVFTVLTKDSSYTINIIGKIVGSTSYTEYVDVYIDWNRNGLFDEPAISLGSANYTGLHTFSGTVTVPNNVLLGKTKMRVILKYNSAINSGCENNYGYGETEDYMIEINEVGTVSYSWSGSGFSSNNQNDSISNINLSQSGLFTLNVTDGLSCVNTDTKNVTVNQLPQITFNSIPDVCANDSPISLSQASPAGGTYSGAGVSSGNFDPTVAGIGTHTITYTYSDANSCMNSATQTITVNPLPNPVITNVPDFCENDANLFNLTASPSGGVFSGNGVVTNNKFDATIAGVGNHQITYTYTDANNCVGSTNTSVTINPIAHVNAGNDTTINYGTSAQLNGSVQNSSGFNFNWSPATLVQTVNALSPSTVNLTQSQWFTLSAINQTTGCNDTDDVLVTVVGGPISVNVSANQTSICQGQSVQLSSIVSGGVVGANIVHAWTSSPIGFNSPVINPTVNPTVTTTYYCSVTDGTTADQDSITIVVNPLPNVTFSLPFANLCETDSTFYDMNNYVSPGGGVFSGTGISSNILFAGNLGLGNTTITYTFTDLNGCTNSAQQSVTVIAKPQLTISNIPNYCVNDGIDTLDFVSPTGGDYFGNGVINNILFDPSIAGTGVHNINYYYVDANQCSNHIDTTIEVFSNPTANAGSNQSVATGNSVILSGSGSGGSGNYSYQWEPTAQVINPNNQNTPTVSLNTSTVFTLEVSDNNSSCSDIDSTLITITGGALNVIAYANPNIICEGGSANLFAIGSGGSGNYTYLWKTFPAGFTANTQNINVSPSQTTVYIIELNDNGSTVTDTITITVNPSPQINLGSDTALCSNSIYTLDAGSGYTSYFWSNGSTNQTVNIDPQQIGVGIHQFFVNVTNSSGCSASDTVNISIGQKPYVNIGIDDTICHYSTKYLDAGFGFDNYLWNTGETSQIIQVGLPLNNANMGNNIYKVEVWNQTTCIASDSINIFVEFCESIQNFDDNRSIEIYPNPTSDKLNLNFVGFQDQDITIELLDNTGRRVFATHESIKIDKSYKTISIEKFAKGIYYINIISESGIYREKIIVQ